MARIIVLVLVLVGTVGVSVNAGAQEGNGQLIRRLRRR